MVLADLDQDGYPDLVVGTKTGTYTGELLVFKLQSKSSGNRYKLSWSANLSGAVAPSSPSSAW